MQKWRVPTRLMLPAFTRCWRAASSCAARRFDPFGWTAHRRSSARLIARVRARRSTSCSTGSRAENLPLAVEIASLPEHVRGFDDVKERTSRRRAHKEQELLAAFRLHT